MNTLKISLAVIGLTAVSVGFCGCNFSPDAMLGKQGASRPSYDGYYSDGEFYPPYSAQGPQFSTSETGPESCPSVASSLQSVTSGPGGVISITVDQLSDDTLPSAVSLNYQDTCLTSSNTVPFTCQSGKPNAQDIVVFTCTPTEPAPTTGFNTWNSIESSQQTPNFSQRVLSYLSITSTCGKTVLYQRVNDGWNCGYNDGSTDVLNNGNVSIDLPFLWVD